MRGVICRLVLGLGAFSLSTLFALADGFEDGQSPYLAPPPDNQWQTSFSPYAWLPWFSGSLTVKGQKVDIDTSIFELLGESDSVIPWETDTIIPFMGYLEGRNGKFSTYLDTIYAKVGISGDGAAQAEPLPGIGLSLRGETAVKLEYVVVEAGAGYEIARSGANSNTSVDVFAGVRYWHQELSLALSLDGAVSLPPGFELTGSYSGYASGTANWVDPLIGLKVRYGIAPGQRLSVRGDIGGFGVGSDFTWQAVATYNYDFGEAYGIDWSGVLGYRALYADYSDGSGINRYTFNLLQHGPLLGLTMRF